MCGAHSGRRHTRGNLCAGSFTLRAYLGYKEESDNVLRPFNL